MAAYERVQHGGGAVATTLSGSLSSGATSVAITASTGWPDGATGVFYAVIDAGLSTEEKIKITTRTGTTLNTVTRGVDGTSAAAHSSGAAIAHIFSAAEADEANILVNKTLGAVTAKGDTILGTASGTLGKLAVGANDTVNVADSAQTTGQKWATITSAMITDGTIVQADLAAALQWKSGTYSGTTDANGQLIVTHSAGYTPTAVLLTANAAAASATNRGLPCLFTIGATTFTIQMSTIAGSMASLSIGGQWWTIP